MGILLSIPFAVAVLVVAGWLAMLARNRKRFVVQEFPEFLSDHECAHLIARAQPLLRMSTAASEGAAGGHHLDRDSSTAFLDQAGDKITHAVKLRIAELTDTPIENQERIQITHYRNRQRYDDHYDSLRAVRLDPGQAGDRYCTVIMYLNDDYEGGGTYFPRIRRKVEPAKGKAVLFHNLSADGSRYDRLSLHRGEVVLDGEKWLSNQWIRQNRRHAAPAKKRGATGAKRNSKRRSKGNAKQRTRRP